MPLFDRIRSHVSSQGTETDPHDWKLNKSYSSSKPGGKVTTVPVPATFRNVFIPPVPLSETASSNNESNHVLNYPDSSHAAVHLCLLECFRNLKSSAEKYGITAQRPPAYEEKAGSTSETNSAPVKSEKWQAIIELAVTRFATWWMNIDQVFHHATAYTHHAGSKSVVQLTKDYVPPLDVLLVWYAFMLDEAEYASACRERGMFDLQHLCFPWPAIYELVNTENMTFHLPKAASNLFSTLSGQSADILTYLSSPPAYTETPHLPFAIDLVSHIQRQEQFIDAAHNLLWVRSPALKGSLERSMQIYAHFQGFDGVNSTLASKNLPFGVDLIWRTHRLYPAQYWQFCNMLGVDPDTKDSPAEYSSSTSSVPVDEKRPRSDPSAPPPGSASDQDSSSKSTSRVPASQICACWTCERIRDDLPAYTAPPPTTSPPDASVQLLSTLSSEAMRQIQDDICFYRAVEAARRDHQTLPTRPPTAAEKQAEKDLARKQDEVGVLPGLGYYVEVSSSGRKKIKRHKNMNATAGINYMTGL